MSGKNIRFDGPGRYVVITKEDTSPEIVELFAGKIEISELPDEVHAGSEIVVEIKDQSELLSLLNMLYDNHHTILKIERLSNRIIDQAYPL